MSLLVKHCGHRRGGWPALGALALGLAAPGARAEQWVVENSLASRYETNDNAALAQSSPGSMNTLSLSTAWAAARRTESSATRMNAAVTSLSQWGPGAQDRVDGQLGLGQSLSDTLNSVNLGLQYLQDFNSTVGNNDVTVGRGRRRSRTLSGAWARSLTERVSVNTQLSLERTAYGQALAGATDYRNTALSGSLSYRLTEVDTLSLDASHSDYRTEADTNRSTTDQVGLGVSKVLSDRNSASLSLGLYRTQTQALRSRLVCPLADSFCDAGFVSPVVATDRVYTTGQGLQFSLSERYQFDETTDFSFSAARQQLPSGAGLVVRSDTLRASVSHAFSPTVNGAVNYAQSRSTYLGLDASAPRPAQQNLAVWMTRQLAADLSLQLSYQFSRAHGAFAGQDARSNSVSVSVSYDWPKFDATR